LHYSAIDAGVFHQIPGDAMATKLLLALALSIATAAPQNSSVKSLTGVSTINVEMAELGDWGIEEYLGLNQTRKDAEHKLRLAGIKVEQSAIPNLFIALDYRGRRYVQGRYQEYDSYVELQFKQSVKLDRNGMEMYVTTWNKIRHVGGPADSAREQIRKAILDMIDSFIDDYFEANPKR
jgi:hypothetical protein